MQGKPCNASSFLKYQKYFVALRKTFLKIQSLNQLAHFTGILSNQKYTYLYFNKEIPFECH